MESGAVNCGQLGYLAQDTVGAAGTQTEGVGVCVVVEVDVIVGVGVVVEVGVAVDVANVVGVSVVVGAPVLQSRLKNLRPVPTLGLTFAAVKGTLAR